MNKLKLSTTYFTCFSYPLVEKKYFIDRGGCFTSFNVYYLLKNLFNLLIISKQTNKRF